MSNTLALRNGVLNCTSRLDPGAQSKVQAPHINRTIECSLAPCRLAPDEKKPPAHDRPGAIALRSVNQAAARAFGAVNCASSVEPLSAAVEASLSTVVVTASK